MTLFVFPKEIMDLKKVTPGLFATLSVEEGACLRLMSLSRVSFEGTPGPLED